MHQFYFRRRVIEYGVKTTISASLVVAIILGGPPGWVIGGAALMLHLTSYILNKFNPSQYMDEKGYQAKVGLGQLIDDKGALETFRHTWCQNHQNYLFHEDAKNLYSLQKRVAFTLVTDFVLFTILNASLSIPIILASLLYSQAFIYKTSEKTPPYVEEEESIKKLYV